MFDAPFNDTISALSGFVITIDIPFAVSMLDPPPTATITSAPDFLQASIPSVTFFIVGFGFTSEYTSKGIPAFSKTSVTLLITPHSANDLSVTTNAFLNPLFFISGANSSLAPFPKYDVSFNINLTDIFFYTPSFESYSSFIRGFLFI